MKFNLQVNDHLSTLPLDTHSQATNVLELHKNKTNDKKEPKWQQQQRQQL